jgi:hypothetical protein
VGRLDVDLPRTELVLLDTLNGVLRDPNDIVVR